MSGSRHRLSGSNKLLTPFQHGNADFTASRLVMLQEYSPRMYVCNTFARAKELVIRINACRLSHKLVFQSVKVTSGKN